MGFIGPWVTILRNQLGTGSSIAQEVCPEFMTEQGKVSMSGDVQVGRPEVNLPLGLGSQ